MKITNLITRGSLQTIGASAASQFLRFLANIALARLLAPELFGIMTIVNSVRTGITLVSDIGVAQNIIISDKADQPDFYNTAWSLNLVRSLLLCVVCALLGTPLAHFYQIDELAIIFPTSGLLFVFAGLTSLAPLLMQKRLQFGRLNLFDLAVDAIGHAGNVIMALISPTVWALVLGGFVAFSARMIGSYLIMPGFRHRFFISKELARQMLGLGRWIFLAAVAYFFSTNIDRLYLGKLIPLDLLGVYSVARSLSEPASLLVNRLSRVIVFPVIASSAETPRHELRKELATTRLVFLLLTASSFAVLAAGGDLVVHLLYDNRYRAAGWMLPALLVGVWFSVLSDLNESTLMGFGRPWYGALANCVKLVWLVVGLPLGFATHGFVGVLLIVASADILRYAPILIGQLRVQLSFFVQDFALTTWMLGSVALLETARWALGYGITDLAPLFR